MTTLKIQINTVKKKGNLVKYEYSDYKVEFSNI